MTEIAFSVRGMLPKSWDCNEWAVCMGSLRGMVFSVRRR